MKSNYTTNCKETLLALPTPLKNISANNHLRPSDFRSRLNEALPDELRRKIQVSGNSESCIDTVNIGELTVISGKTAPTKIECQVNSGFAVSICFQGRVAYQNDEYSTLADSKEILIHPKQGGSVSTTFYSGIGFQLDKKRVLKTIDALTGNKESPGVNVLHHYTNSGSERGMLLSKKLFKLFNYIDILLQEDSYIPTALGLDDQIYRIIALECISPNQHWEDRARRIRRSAKNNAIFDDLIDFIKNSENNALSLTDLEHHSRYSRRQLQSLFKSKFNVTPMEFVRNQKLEKAMERLKNPENSDNIARISREFGYRHTANFSSDFSKKYEVRASEILRMSKDRRTIS